MKKSSEAFVVFGAIKNLDRIAKCISAVNIVCIADNDPSKWGDEHYGFRVVPPAELINIKFDKVIIASYAFNSIREQLLSLGVDANKIISISKRVVSKPKFELENVRKFSLQFISKLCQLVSSSGAIIFVEAGTLLGLVRDNDLIHWDSDIDLSVREFEAEKVLAIIEENSLKLGVDFGFNYTVAREKTGKIFQIVGNVKLDDIQVPFDIFVRSNLGSSSVSNSGDFFKVPRVHFDSAERLIVSGLGFTVPYEAGIYLENLFGADWRTPRPDFSYADYNYN